MRRKDFVRQKDSMQCGVAALAMVCRHFGADYSLDFISGFCHATNVVESGDHASLIAKRGTYYNLVKNQLELGT